MCMTVLKSPAERKKWLDKKPDTFIVYKTVVSGKAYNPEDENYYPPFYLRSTPFKEKINELKRVPSEYAQGYNHKKPGYFSYLPYFHLFATKQGALKLKGTSSTKVVLRCRVQKKDVKNIGIQWDHLTLVVRRFEILGEVKCA